MQTALKRIADFNRKVIDFSLKFEFKNSRIKLLFSVILFILCLHMFYTYVGIYSFLDVRPSSIHSSAQCQRASIALNYYETDMNFFKPRVQKFSEMGGVTGVEFPIMYYLDAVVYKLFGFNESNARLVSLILVSIGLFFFFLLTNKFLKNSLLSIAIVGSASFSPAFLFYTPNFMPDAPSVALVLIGWYYFFEFNRTRSLRSLNLFFLFMTLAALIKVVALMALIIFICLLVLDKWKFYSHKNNQPLFNKPFILFIKTGVCILVVFSWYFYANWLATAYKNETFSLSPVMGDSGTFNEVINNVRTLWIYHYYTYETYVLLGGGILFMILFTKYVNRLLATITILYLIGNVAFVFFFLNQFINHDYYVISILPLVFFLLLTFVDCLVRVSDRFFALIKFVFFIILVFNMKECLLNCKRNYHYRYSNEIYFWSQDFRAYYDLEKRLREVGIKRDDLTLSGFDDTFCSSLYLMNQIGIPISTGHDKAKITEMINYKNSKYLILSDTATFNKTYPNNLANKIILTHRGLIVYKLK